jgi:hypothetical protein
VINEPADLGYVINTDDTATGLYLSIPIGAPPRRPSHLAHVSHAAAVCVRGGHVQIYCIAILVSDYGLDDRAIGVRFPAGAKDFSSNLCVQTGSEAHPASCTMGSGGPIPRAKARPGRDADHSPPSSAEVKNE